MFGPSLQDLVLFCDKRGAVRTELREGACAGGAVDFLKAAVEVLHVDIKNDELVRSWNSGDDRIEVFIEPVFGFVWVGHGGYIGADDGGELLSMGKGESHRCEAVVQPFQGAS